MREFLLISLLLLGGLAHAASESYPLDSEAERERFNTLTSELRCPKCQNQSIADSNAPIASDMRAEVHRLVQQGESNEAIMEAMTSRFGEFVRYKPELDQRTFLLWFTPLIVVVIGVAAVALVVVRSRRASSENEPVLSETDRRKVDGWLSENASPSDNDEAQGRS
ncbi:cytochrome c-type biogenesis protein CcmH [Marinobacter nanhaiticus D15-8W]|uniref:Cytochrome c-type biogenesis protein n=1 Tax=Marinobacter nanhaiticus D15-8W TaxID=626887 RepID=N6W9Y3_9GAMM|nr:cytochrome c-type biogenesis protein [Marinobacter nanhaiticus]ENO17069.1 cytochrome c-type biogenesis protein CcmH [Marinobacter nanhaiticus D15-8W]BES71935.1 cytochrome c-type biogenesis protein CcmH [Marinobacter nanhaiticus D15-8W]